ncbi:MAG: hypothetical protein U9O86_03305 [Campylobacterota bacterium]|nr:hypothetical protein [Campylobacterota bacterium]
MKKSILIVALLLVIIAILPIIGNSFMKSRIDERILKLDSFGLATTKDDTNSTYLNTSRHFEFILKDSQKFKEYIKQYSDKQMPTYVDALLSGMLVGADVEYSNLPFAKAFSIDIYPIALSSSAQEKIALNDLALSVYVEKFLQNKGIFYHIEYNLLNDDFKGHIKEIDEKYTYKNQIKIEAKLEKAHFSGNGPLVAPNKLKSKIKELYLNIKQDSMALKMAFKKFSAKSNFETKSTYVTSAEIKEVDLTLSGTQNDINISMQKIKLNGSSNDQGATTELNSKVSVKEMEYNSQGVGFSLNKLELDVALNELNKEKFESLRVMMSQKENLESFLEEKELQNAMLELLSKGLLLEIANFSLKSIEMDNGDDLKGFKIKSKITIKEDTSLAQKIQLSPLLAISNIDLLSNIRLSKEIYMLLLNSQPILQTLTRYVKEDGDYYIFDIKFINSQMSINDKALY